MLLLRELRLHFLEGLDELWQIFDVEHDRRLLAAAALFADLEELTITGLLEVDIERALACVNRDAVHVISKVSATATRTRRTWRARLHRSRTAHEGIVGTTCRRCEISHGIEHKKKGRK